MEKTENMVNENKKQYSKVIKENIEKYCQEGKRRNAD